MAKTASLHIRIEPEIKREAEGMFSKFGITISDAVNMFIKQSLFVGGFPFELRQPRYNIETEAAIKEANDIIAGRVKVKSYKSVAEMNADLDAELDGENV
jgi:DNA-damage-inducible protein J